MATTSIVSAYVVNRYFNASMATHIHIIYVATLTDVVTSVTCNFCASYFIDNYSDHELPIAVGYS